MRPYFQLQALHFFFQSASPFFSLGYLIFLFHWVYYPLNLSEILNLQTETILIQGYWIIPLVLLILGLRRAFLSRRQLAAILENQFSLDFKLINSLEIVGSKKFSSQDKQQAELFIKANLHKKFLPFIRALLPWRKNIPLALLIAATVLFHSFDRMGFNRFLENAHSLIRAKPVSYSLEVPEKIREGDPLTLTASGNFLDAELSWRGKTLSGAATLSNRVPFFIPQVAEDLTLRFVLRSGRAVKTEERQVWLHRKPEIRLIETTLTDPMNGETRFFKGSTRVDGLPGNRVLSRFEIQSDQRVDKVMVDGLPPGFFVSRESNRFFIASAGVQTASLVIQLQNDQGLLLASPLPFSYTVKENLPPSVFIKKPSQEIRLQKREALEVEFQASDDIGLASCRLQLLQWSAASPDPLAETSASHGIPKNTGESRQIDGRMSLPWESLEILPGHWVSYFMEVRDVYGLTSRSATNTVHLLSLAEVYEEQKKFTESVSENFSSQKREADDIRRESEKLSLLKEQGKSDPRQSANLADRISRLRQKMEEESRRLNDFKKNSELTPELFSSEIREKFSQIEEAYRQIDRDLLRKMEEEFRAAIGPLPPQDPSRLPKDTDPKKLSERLDNLLKSLEELKQMQEVSALSKMAENLYQKYEDLKAFSLSQPQPDFFDRNKKEVTEPYRELRESFQKKKESLFSTEQKDTELSAIQKRLEEALGDDARKKFEDFKGEGKKAAEFNAFSENFDRIRKDFQLLERRNQELNLESALTEINHQINGFLLLGRQARAMESGEVFDPERTDPEVVQREAIRFLSAIDAHLEKSRTALYEEIAGFIPGISGFFDIYRLALDKNRLLQRQMDPSGLSRADNRFPSPLFRENRLSLLELSRHLILLKNALKEQEESRQNQNAMENGESRQKQLGSRTRRMAGKSQSLSEAQKEFLRESAREQAAIRQLMEQARSQTDGKGQNQPGENPGGNESESGGTPGSEAKKSLDKLIESMKRAEEGLQNIQEGDREKILAQQKEIEENLLRFQKGIRERKEDEKDERESNTAKTVFEGSRLKPDESSLGFRDRLEQLRKTRHFPAGYETRMRAYLEKLQERKSMTEPSGPVR